MHLPEVNKWPPEAPTHSGSSLITHILGQHCYFDPLTTQDVRYSSATQNHATFLDAKSTVSSETQAWEWVPQVKVTSSAVCQGTAHTTKKGCHGLSTTLGRVLPSYNKFVAHLCPYKIIIDKNTSTSMLPGNKWPSQTRFPTEHVLNNPCIMDATKLSALNRWREMKHICLYICI